jgi:hypothetical protein
MENNVNNGIGLDGAVFIVFLILKLMNVIDWSWWWVCSPLWIPFCIAIVIAIIVFLISR